MGTPTTTRTTTPTTTDTESRAWSPSGVVMPAGRIVPQGAAEGRAALPIARVGKQPEPLADAEDVELPEEVLVGGV